ncbi:MAG: hypothetical protein DBY09_01170 [Selenomonadales bacterium]|nr:MAG: hypothetical protein DBY09_01170 [Selenomonadales bacterium]
MSFEIQQKFYGQKGLCFFKAYFRLGFCLNGLREKANVCGRGFNSGLPLACSLRAEEEKKPVLGAPY